MSQSLTEQVLKKANKNKQKGGGTKSTVETLSSASTTAKLATARTSSLKSRSIVPRILTTLVLLLHTND